jgi:hypothetical protein
MSISENDIMRETLENISKMSYEQAFKMGESVAISFLINEAKDALRLINSMKVNGYLDSEPKNNTEVIQDSSWQPSHTIPQDKEVLIKTSTGIVSGKYFPGELSRENPYHNEEYKAPVFSCYDDAIVLDCDYQELVEGEVEEYFPEILGWMEIPK